MAQKEETPEELANFGKDVGALVRAIVRDELRQWEERKRQGCTHARSGTLDENSDLFCDDCGRLLGEDDGPTPGIRGGL